MALMGISSFALDPHHNPAENVLSILINESIYCMIVGMKKYLTATETTSILGVSAATLYAYVSRGLIRSEAIDGSSRNRRYNAEDVQKLKARKSQRKNPAEAAKLALRWGSPILESAL